MQDVHAGRKPLKRAYVAIFLWFMGRAIQAAAKVDKEVKKEFDALPDDFTFSLGCLPNGPWMVIGKENGKVKYFGGNPKCRHIHIRLVIKSVDAAFLILSFQESTVLTTARNRLMTDGEVPYALAVIRVLDIVEVYLLPKIIASLAVKRYPSWWSIGRKFGGRIGSIPAPCLGSNERNNKMELSAGFAFTCPFKTNSGNRALEHLPVELSGLNAFKPLIITSLDLVGSKAIRRLTDAFGDSGMTMGVFHGIMDIADLSIIEQLKDIFIKGQYDSIIALGGGVVVDVAKVVNLAVSLKVADASQLSGETAIRGPLGPFVVVPTSAVTGLETSKYAFVNRMPFVSIHLMPNLVIIDTRMIRAEGERAIADAGLAAFGRALEAYIAPDRNPFMDAYAFAALRFIRENLITAVKNPNDKKASLAIANAAAMSGCAISNTGQGVLHRLGLVFHDMVNVHPGMIMGMCLIPVITDYLNKDSYLVSTLLHPLTGDDKYAATPETKRAEATLSDLRRFLNDLYGILEDRRIRRTLKDVGISKYMMDDILEVLGREPDGAYLRTVIERVWDRPVKA